MGVSGGIHHNFWHIGQWVAIENRIAAERRKGGTEGTQALTSKPELRLSRRGRRGGCTGILAVVAALAFMAYFAAMLALHALPTGRSPLADALSHYATGTQSRIAHLSSVSSIVGIASLTAALLAGVGSPPLASTGLIALAVMAATRLGTRVFPLDPPGKRLTPAGYVHWALAVVNFVASVAALRSLTRDLIALPGWETAGSALAVLARLCEPLLALVAVTFLLPPLRRRVFGVAERLFVWDVTGWLLIAAVALSVQALGGV